MERFTTSDGSPPKPGWSRTSLLRPMTITGSMLDVQTSHQQRRQTFARGGGVGRDDSGRRMSMSMNTAGLFDSIRRMSLDPSQIQQLAHQARGDDDAHISTVSNYQEVFQKMKQTFPSSASGALHQKTMARLAELKDAREREEQRERERLKREEEEERLRNMTSASKALNKWVGKIRPGNVPVQQEHQDQHDDLTPHHSNIDLTSMQQQQQQQQQQHHREDLHSSSDGILTQLIPMRNHLQDSRRTSMDSGIVSGTSRSTDDVNLAPRLSVGDLTSYFSNCDDETQSPDDKSVLSMLSDPSGLFCDSDENAVSEVSGGKLPSYSTTNGRTDEEDKEEDEPQLSSELLELSIKLGGDPLRRKEKPKSEPIRRRRTRMRGEGGSDMIATGNPCEAFCGDGGNAFNRSRTPHSSEHQCDLNSDDLLVTHVITLCTEKDAYEARNNTMSVASDDMSDCSRASSSGLIVGFSNRRTSIGDSGDDLIVGFVNRSESTRKA